METVEKFLKFYEDRAGNMDNRAVDVEKLIEENRLKIRKLRKDQKLEGNLKVVNTPS